MTAGQLATAARLTTGAITAVLDRLERAGLVRRVPDPADRRRVLVEVTPKLAEVTAPVFGPLGQEGSAWIANYTDDQLELIVGFIEKNRELLARHTSRLQEMLDERDPKRGAAAG
jgi:DNA-binding MarR family transcriptional regulator